MILFVLSNCLKCFINWEICCFICLRICLVFLRIKLGNKLVLKSGIFGWVRFDYRCLLFLISKFGRIRLVLLLILLVLNILMEI